jgi:adenylate kinase
MGTVRKEVSVKLDGALIIICLTFPIIHRGYPLKKIQENNEAEIMEIVLEEARSSYPSEIVVELQSEGMEDLEGNVARIVEWIQAWRKDRGFVDGGS